MSRPPDLAAFDIEVSEVVLDELRQRLALTRLPNQVDGIGWEQGTELDYLRELVSYWHHSYDWRRVERELRAYEHLRAEVEGQPIHVLHARSAEPDALPILLVHGWPGSVIEFLDAIGPLVDPAGHGGDARDAFHVIAPSLPGFGYSGPTTRGGWHPRRIAAAFADTMEALGYERYGAQGGDWGSLVTTNVADLRPDAVAGLHLNFVVVRPPRDTDAPLPSGEELAALERLRAWRRHGAGYQEIQGTRPQTLGYALQDSPAGLAAWIVEKFREWSDCGGDVERSFTRDRLLDNITLYWLTGTATSSARIYWEARQARGDAFPDRRVEVPTGIACYPAEVTRFPRAWVDLRYHVTHWVDQPRGGHFAAMEVPDLFVDDVRAFFRTVR